MNMCILLMLKSAVLRVACLFRGRLYNKHNEFDGKTHATLQGGAEAPFPEYGKGANQTFRATTLAWGAFSDFSNLLSLSSKALAPQTHHVPEAPGDDKSKEDRMRL